jgi:tetratricopeptide (TPR) repeat protein
MQAGDVDAAEAHFAEARRRGEAARDDSVVAGARNGEGYVAVTRGDFASAVTAFREAVTMSEGIGGLQGALRAMGNLGFALMNQGLITEATEAFERSLELARATGNRGSEAAALQNLAWATQAGGTLEPGSERHAKTDGLLRSAIAIFDELGYRRELANALMSLTAVARDKHEGLAALARAEGLLRQAGDEDGVARVAQARSDFLEWCG